jgi:hypothetical protein
MLRLLCLRSCLRLVSATTTSATASAATSFDWLRCEHTAQHTANEFRGLLGDRERHTSFNNLVHKLYADLLVGIFTAAILQGDLDLVALVNETLNLAQLVFKIARIGRGMEFDFLNLNNLLVFARLFTLNALLITELAIVHDFTDWRFCVRRHLYEIKSLCIGKALRLARCHNAEHLSCGIQQANGLDSNLEVYTNE